MDGGGGGGRRTSADDIGFGTNRGHVFCSRAVAAAAHFERDSDGDSVLQLIVELWRVSGSVGDSSLVEEGGKPVHVANVGTTER